MVTRLIQESGTTVQAGPFIGMELSVESSWGDGDLLPKLLGSYEAELHPWLSLILKRSYDYIIDVGCAEGYYVVGFARLFPPTTRIFGFDISEDAQRICRLTCEKNHVHGNVTISGRCTVEDLGALLAQAERPFLFLDCEGGEVELLCNNKSPQLDAADILVECHDFMDRSITPKLYSRFSDTHNVEMVREQMRNLESFPFLCKLGGLQRAIAVCEFRPELMHWLLCTSKRRERFEGVTSNA